MVRDVRPSAGDSHIVGRHTGPAGPASPGRGVNARRRLEDLEARAWGRPSAGPSDARRRMVAHLGRIAKLRRGELDLEEVVEVEAENAAVERRLLELRGEGDR